MFEEVNLRATSVEESSAAERQHDEDDHEQSRRIHFYSLIVHLSAMIQFSAHCLSMRRTSTGVCSVEDIGPSANPPRYP
jgi:hypothetical protein